MLVNNALEGIYAYNNNYCTNDERKIINRRVSLHTKFATS